MPTKGRKCRAEALKRSIKKSNKSPSLFCLDMALILRVNCEDATELDFKVRLKPLMLNGEGSKLYTKDTP